MLQRKKQTNTIRSRRPAQTINESFRRNNVVISRSQRELKARQESVTERQQDRTKQLAKHARHIRLIAVCLVIFMGFLSYRLRITSVQMQSNAASRLTETAAQTYQAAIMQQFHQATIAGQSWLLNTDSLRTSILQQFPEIERVTFSTKPLLSQALQADIRFRTAVFRWQDISGSEQFVDSNGVLFTKNLNPNVTTDKLITIDDQSGIALEAGSSVLTDTVISFVGQLHTALPPLYGPEARVSGVIIPRSTREVQLQIEAQPYVIKFNTTRDLKEQVGELQSLLNFLKTQGTTPTSYIDLRVAHKAFYK